MTNSNYRNTLADDLKKQRKKKTIPFIQKSGRELARTMLEEAKYTDTYKQARIQKFVDLLEHPEGKLTKKLDKKIAFDLIAAGKGQYIVKNIEKFSPENHKEIAHFLISNGLGTDVIKNLDKFNGFDNERFAIYISNRLDSADSFEKEFDFLGKQFIGIDPTNLALLIIDYYPEIIIKNLDKNLGLDHEKLISPIIEKGYGYLLVEHLDKLYHYKPSLRLKEYNRIVKEMMNAQNYPWSSNIGGNLTVILKNLNKFEGLDKSVIEKLNENINSIWPFIEIFEHLGSFDTEAQTWFVNYYIKKWNVPKTTMRPEFLNSVLDSDVALNNIRHLGLWDVFRIMLFDYYKDLFEKYVNKINEISKKI